MKDVNPDEPPSDSKHELIDCLVELSEGVERKKLFRFLKDRFVLDPSKEPADLIQDAYIVVLQAIRKGKLTKVNELRGYLFGILKNLAKQEYRSLQTGGLLSESLKEDGTTEERKKMRNLMRLDPEILERTEAFIYDEMDLVLQLSDKKLRLDRLMALIDELDEPNRTYFLEFYTEGCELKEMAERHGISYSNMKTIMTRTRQRLRRLFKKRHNE